LLGITTVDGLLFHQQGNFPSHGYVENWQAEARQIFSDEDLERVDYERMRLLVHQEMVFVRDATETDMATCSWVHARRR
jgi:hypothetical protein